MTKIEREALSLLIERAKAYASDRELREVQPAILWVSRQLKLTLRSKPRKPRLIRFVDRACVNGHVPDCDCRP